MEGKGSCAPMSQLVLLSKDGKTKDTRDPSKRNATDRPRVRGSGGWLGTYQ
jgi:hypothetical protein